jgi:hypothetical protein
MPRRIDAKQNNARNGTALAKHQIAEILVFRQQQPIFRASSPYSFGIGYRRGDLRSVDDVMSRRAQMRYQSGIDTFIGEPAHD